MIRPLPLDVPLPHRTGLFTRVIVSHCSDNYLLYQLGYLFVGYNFTRQMRLDETYRPCVALGTRSVCFWNKIAQLALKKTT
jgi:hypothetical protein